MLTSREWSTLHHQHHTNSLPVQRAFVQQNWLAASVVDWAACRVDTHRTCPVAVQEAVSQLQHWTASFHRVVEEEAFELTFENCHWLQLAQKLRSLAANHSSLSARNDCKKTRNRCESLWTYHLRLLCEALLRLSEPWKLHWLLCGRSWCRLSGNSLRWCRRRNFFLGYELYITLREKPTLHVIVKKVQKKNAH